MEIFLIKHKKSTKEEFNPNKTRTIS